MNVEQLMEQLSKIKGDDIYKPIIFSDGIMYNEILEVKEAYIEPLDEYQGSVYYENDGINPRISVISIEEKKGW